MCGFMGAIGLEFGLSTLANINHRGPDSKGIWKDESVCLGHTRLAIQDLTDAGQQPMVSNCGKYVLVFNGEIYNHINLKNEIKFTNYNGHSDTETLLYFLIENGIQSLSRLNGIFSFAFYDINSNKVYLCRDKFGVKPLYYAKHDQQLIFGSEIRALKAFNQSQILNRGRIREWFKFRYVPSPNTLFADIKKLGAGEVHCYDLSTSERLGVSYFDYKPKVKSTTEREALDKYDQLLRESVERQLLSDVPITILLSGGVDSALLAKLVAEQSGSPLVAYTAGYNIDTDSNEIKEARRSAFLLGCELKEVILDADNFFSFLPELIRIVEEPLGSQSIYPLYFLAKKIHDDGYKVVLTGQGVDEPWGGYGRYKHQQLFEKLSVLFNWLPTSFGSFIKNEKLRRAILSILENTRSRRFLQSYSIFDDEMLNRLLKNTKLTNDNEWIHQEILRLELTSSSATEAMMGIDARNNLSDDLLTYTDKISMHHSLEFRVPYLDIELMSFVESLPTKFKVGRTGHKILHKKYAEKILPKEIVYRPKKGFYTPREAWFRTEKGRDEFNKISTSIGLFGDLFNGTFIQEIFENHYKNKVNYEKQLYMLLVFYYWLSQYE